MYRCRLIRLTPSLRAASRVEWVAILIYLISDWRAGVNREKKAKVIDSLALLTSGRSIWTESLSNTGEKKVKLAHQLFLSVIVVNKS